MDNIMGAIDGTFFKLERPIFDNDYGYIYRKGFPAINCLAMCDHRVFR